MKSLFDIVVTTANGDTFQLKGISFSKVAQLANQTESIKQIHIKKEYLKRIK